MAEKRGGISVDLKEGVTPPTEPPPRPADIGRTNGHRTKVIEAPSFLYSECLTCDWNGPQRTGPVAQREVEADGRSHEVDLAVEPVQMGGEPPASTADPLTLFLYLLLRDHVQPGVIEGLVQTQMRYMEPGPRECDLSNAWLAGCAKNLADRIRDFGPPA